MDHDEARGPGDSPGSIEEPCVERQGERATCRGISKEATKGEGIGTLGSQNYIPSSALNSLAMSIGISLGNTEEVHRVSGVLFNED